MGVFSSRLLNANTANKAMMVVVDDEKHASVRYRVLDTRCSSHKDFALYDLQTQCSLMWMTVVGAVLPVGLGTSG